MCDRPSHRAPGARRVVSEPRPAPVEWGFWGPKSVFKIVLHPVLPEADQLSYWGRWGSCPQAGDTWDSKRPYSKSHRVSTPRCLLRDRKAPGRVPFPSLLSVHFIVYLQCDQGHASFRRHCLPFTSQNLKICKSWTSNSYFDEDIEEGWELPFFKYLLDGRSRAKSYSNPPKILEY